MTIDEALRCISVAYAMGDGTEKKAALVDGLHRVLIERPELFWSTYLEVKEALREDPMLDLALRLMDEGRFTWDDAKAALAEYNAPASLPPQRPDQKQ